MGGVKPGASIPEVAERILLVTECSLAWESCGKFEEAEKVMSEGLSEWIIFNFLSEVDEMVFWVC